MTDDATNASTDVSAPVEAQDVTAVPEETPVTLDSPEDSEKPALYLSAGVWLPTSDDVAADQIETTAAVTSEKKKFIVWDAINLVLVSGPHDTEQDAQISIDFKSAKESRSVSYVGPVLSIETVSDANA